MVAWMRIRNHSNLKCIYKLNLNSKGGIYKNMQVTRSYTSGHVKTPIMAQLNFKLLALAIVVSSVASAIFANAVFGEPLDLSLRCFGCTGAMGLSICFLYSFIINAQIT